MTSATSTNTLGFILWTVALALVGWAATVAGDWWRLKQKKVASPFRDALVESIWPGVFLAGGILGLVLVALGVFTVLTVYDDHQEIITENRRLRGLGGGNPYTIPLNNQYAATINTLNAFKSLAENNHKCIIRISYPDKNSQQNAAVLRSLASVVGCNVDEIRPDEPRGMIVETNFKSIPRKILIRSRRKDASGFASALGNAFDVKISEDLPPKEPLDLIWLQIGEGDVSRKQ